MLEVDVRAKQKDKIVHVADREADDYTTFAELTSHEMRFVIRSQYNLVRKEDVQEAQKLLSCK